MVFECGLHYFQSSFHCAIIRYRTGGKLDVGTVKHLSFDVVVKCMIFILKV